MRPELSRCAELLDDAARNRAPVRQISATTALTADEAYEIQHHSVARRISRGETLVGVKMGFTSRAKMAQMGLSELIWGRLTSGMRLEDGGKVDLSRFIHPRIEPEIAFLLARPLRGAVSPAEAALAVAAVAPALEIIDSRYENFQFSLPDVIADNTSASAFVLGAWHPLCDVSNLGMVLSVDGLPAQVGSSAAVLGHPLRALAAASRLCAERGLVLQEGSIVLSGGATAAIPLARGTLVEAEVQSLGVAQIMAAP